MTERLGSPMPFRPRPYGREPGEVTILRRIAQITGEPLPPHPAEPCYPETCCPVIGSFLEGWEGLLTDADREALIHPLAPRLVGTRGHAAIRARRAAIAAEWLASLWYRPLLRADRVTSSPNPDGGPRPLLSGMRQEVIRAAEYARGAAPRQPRLRSWEVTTAEGHRVAVWLAHGAAAWRDAWFVAGRVAEVRPLGTLAELERGIVDMLERMIEVRPAVPYQAYAFRRKCRPVPYVGWRPETQEAGQATP